MYTSYIGQRLLALYNQHPDTACVLTARQFFEQEMYPLFFEPAKYLQWVPNSPFAQAVAARDLVPGGPTAAEIRLMKFHRNIETVAPDASFVIGFPAAGVEGTTSGQVSNVGPVVGGDEIYCSWIGGALGVGVSGGLSLLLDEDDVLWALYEGWARYRKFLNQRSELGMKGNQIDTWNGHWLAHVFGDRYDPEHPMDELEIKLTDTAGTLSMPTREWVQVLFALARHYPAGDLTAYVYSLAQTNRTIGFIPLKMTRISRMLDQRESLLVFSDTLESEGRDDLWKFYVTQYSFAYACQQGAIGVTTLKPENIQQYIGENQKSEKSLLTSTGKPSIHFAFYQIWIIAMLDRPGIYNAADRLAHTLLNFTQANKRATKENKGVVAALWKTKGRKAFVDSLIDLLGTLDREQGRQVVDELEAAVDHAHALPFDQIPYFVTLTHFRYLAASLRMNDNNSNQI